MPGSMVIIGSPNGLVADPTPSACATSKSGLTSIGWRS